MYIYMKSYLWKEDKLKSLVYLRVRVMVFNATFNNISVILGQSVLLVKETVIPREYQQSVASHGQTLSHNVVPRHEQGSNSQL